MVLTKEQRIKNLEKARLARQQKKEEKARLLKEGDIETLARELGIKIKKVGADSEKREKMEKLKKMAVENGYEIEDETKTQVVDKPMDIRSKPPPEKHEEPEKAEKKVVQKQLTETQPASSTPVVMEAREESKNVEPEFSMSMLKRTRRSLF